jgi:hypothetical protein
MSVQIQLNSLHGIARIARFESMAYNHVLSIVSTTWKIVPVDANGVEIESPMLKQYHVQLIADRSTFVNPATGEQVPEGTEGSLPEYDYFVYIASNVPVKVHDLIIQTAMTANQNGRFDS